MRPLIKNAPLGRQSWFGCGGDADLLFQPDTAADLQAFLQSYPKDAPLAVLGGLANTIIRDGGIRGVVVQLGKSMALIETKNALVTAQAGALNGSAAAAAAKAGIGGLEFLSGIPGTVGGAVFMNAGAYGAEIADVLTEADIVLRSGALRTLKNGEMGFGYRCSHLPEGAIVVRAVFQGRKESPDLIRARLKDIKARRNETQPIREKTGGSTFANPSTDDLARAGLPESLRAWQAVERVDGRGLRIGGAQMSEMHCNFMVNTGQATAADLESLGEQIRTRARETLGLDLHWEIRRVGEHSP